MILYRTWTVAATPAFDRPIVFTRALPTGVSEALGHGGLCVEVRVRPDLRIVVLLAHCLRAGLTGRYARDRVIWDQAPSAEFPATAHAIIAADVCDALHLFRRGFIDPHRWTSHPAALAQL